MLSAKRRVLIISFQECNGNTFHYGWTAVANFLRHNLTMRISLKSIAGSVFAEDPFAVHEARCYRLRTSYETRPAVIGLRMHARKMSPRDKD